VNSNGKTNELNESSEALYKVVSKGWKKKSNENNESENFNNLCFD